MSSIKLKHASGNSMSIAAPATNPASDLSIKLPATIGTAGQVLKNSDTAGTLEFGPPPRPYRNLIINGSMQIAVRGTSSTTSGMYTVDRWTCNFDGGAVTQSQGTETSGTVFQKGFRNYLRVTNTSNTTGTDKYRFMQTALEAQDIANSGWSYNSTSSYLTLSFWVRSSLAGTYYGFLKASDGTEYYYPFSTGAISADTWTKITKKIPGNSNLTFNNDSGEGLSVHIAPWYGTDFTDNSITLDAWATMNSGGRGKDYTEAWANTSNATFDLTGVQLEVGDVATDFEHRSYGDELRKCQRYYFEVKNGFIGGARGGSGGSLALWSYPLPTPLRASPTITALTSFSMRAFSSAGNSDSTATPSVATSGWTKDACHLYVSQGSHSIVDDRVASVQQSNGIALAAEL